MTRPVDVVYIAGMGRSGSTVLSQLLGTTAGACSIGEFRTIWERGFVGDHLCGCGATFHTCPFWQDVVKAAFGGYDGVDPQRAMALERLATRWRAIPGLRWRPLAPRQIDAAIREAGDLRLRLLRAVAQVSGARFVIDSSKGPVFGALLGATPGLRVTAVQVVRDSRAVAFSWTRRKRTYREANKEQYMPVFPPRRTAHVWNASNLTGELVLRGPRYVLLHYEDFARDPQAAMDRIRRAAGFEAAPLIPGPEPGTFDQGVHHSVAGNPMRFGGNTISVRVDDEWKRAMAPGDRDEMTRRTGPLLLRYGYAGPWKKPYA
jgi:hypothetical protein